MKKILIPIVLILGCSTVAIAQPTNTSPWPANGAVGLGTARSTSSTPQNALQIHYDAAYDTTAAILRLSEGGSTANFEFGALGLMPGTKTGFSKADYSNLAKLDDLVLHERYGDLILADFKSQSGAAIRMSTTPDPTKVPSGILPNDLERMTIMDNGNVGINMPPEANGLMKPLEQVQIGGGVTPNPGHSYAEPGLTIYGGNRFENVPRYGSTGGFYPADRRYIAFNHYIDHTDTGATRLHRFQPVGSSEIDFSSDNGGLLSFNTEPYDATRGLNSFARKMTLELSGTYGTGVWFFDSSAPVQKHTMFEINPPGIKLGSVTRNTNGLAFFHTPVCITSDTATYMSIDFQNLPIRPNLGDDTTWDLVVNGPALFKEAFVSLDWPDFVFEANYKLMPLQDVARFIANNHHLPGVPSAEQLAKTGVPLGQTEATTMQKIEELTEYVIEQDKKIQSLTEEVEKLKAGKEK